MKTQLKDKSPGGPQCYIGSCPPQASSCVSGVTSHTSCPGILSQNLLLGDLPKEASCSGLTIPWLASQRSPHPALCLGLQSTIAQGRGWACLLAKSLAAL